MPATAVIRTYIPIVARVTRSEADVSGQEYVNESFHSPKLKENGCNCVAKRVFFDGKDQACKEIGR